MANNLSVGAQMDKGELSEKFISVEYQLSQECQVNEALTFCFKPGHVPLSQMVNMSSLKFLKNQNNKRSLFLPF